MRIPESFNLVGFKIKVIAEKQLLHDSSMHGLAVYRDKIIYLQTNTDGVPVSKASIEQTFLHELTHHILDRMGENDLCMNEKFVDVFSSLLHQAITTMKYKK